MVLTLCYETINEEDQRFFLPGREGQMPQQSDWFCAHARPAIWMERMFCCRALRRKRYWPTKAMMLMIASSRHFAGRNRPCHSAQTSPQHPA